MAQQRASFRVGNYLCHTRLGVGGMAEVWLATRQGPGSFEKQLVVKQLLPHLAAERDFSEMFLNEARLAARLSHPNIAQVFDLGEDPSGYFMVMEYVDGRSLRDLVTRSAALKRPFPQTVAAYIIGRACAALHHAHELRDSGGTLTGLVHRDVTPENILASFDGEVKVVDFGIAKATSSAPSRGTLIGKWPYMSPEQASGRPIDRRSDVYSLAVVAYELLTGSRPFSATEPVMLMHQITSEDPRPLQQLRPDVDQGLAAAIHAALHKDPAGRLPDARTLGAAMDVYVRTHHGDAEDLAAFMRETFEREEARQVAPVSSTADTDKLAETRKSSKRGIALATTIALAGVAAVAVYLGSRPSVTPSARVVAAVTVPEPAPINVVVSEPTIETPQHPPRTKAPHGKTDAKAPGSISVRVRPWADILLDGHAIGTTPLPPFDATAGKHQLTAVNGKLEKSKSVSVDVPSGKNVVVEINLLQ